MLKIKKRNLFKIACLVAYVSLTGVLIFEASLNGQSSANQSNQVGGTLADIFNDLSGDQTKIVNPTALTIDNKVSDVYINTTHKLRTTTHPADATYQSVEYVSSNENLATIDADGNIYFHNLGTVNIKAYNAKFPEINDSFNVKINEIKAISISSIISNANKNNDNVYTLYLGTQYSIGTTFNPTNTTNKNLTYSSNASNYISIDDNGTITPLKSTSNSIYEIDVKHGELTNTLKFKVETGNIIDLQSIKISNLSLYVSQSKTPTITFTPYNASYKSYKLTSSNTSIAKISNNQIVGVKAGTATITVTSTVYPSIKGTMTVTVLAKPEADMSKSTIKLTSSLFMSDTAQVQISKYPSYAKDIVATYSSDDPSIATVSSTGKVTAINAGTTNIRVVANNKNYTFPLTVAYKEDIVTKGFTLNQSTTNIYCGKDYNIEELFYVNTWSPSLPNNPTLTYTSLSSNSLTLENNILNISVPGTYQFDITHKPSGINKTVSITSAYDFNIKDNNNLEINELNLFVNQTKLITVESSFEEQTYKVISSDESLLSVNKIDNSFAIQGNNNGSVTLTVIPTYDDKEYTSLAKTISVNISHIYSSSLVSYIVDEENNYQTPDKNIVTLKLGNKYYIKNLLSGDTTNHSFSITSSDENILKVESLTEIIPVNTGLATITVKEKYSNLEYKINIKVINQIFIDSENPFTIKGEKLSYNQLLDEYLLRNGYIAGIRVNFLEGTTYDKVTFNSSNEEVATIGKDGVITPLKEGTTIITVTCDDGELEPYVVELKLRVLKQELIKDISTFLYKVRKGIGHFGAFLVLGIFSTLTWSLFFNDKKLFFSIPVNIVLGCGIAALTEYIQLFVPGRYGALSDVILDCSGFMISTVIISITFIVIAIVQYVKRKKNK